MSCKSLKPTSWSICGCIIGICGCSIGICDRSIGICGCSTGIGLKEETYSAIGAGGVLSIELAGASGA